MGGASAPKPVWNFQTAKTQPYPVGDAVMPQYAPPFGDYEKAGCLFEPCWEEPVLIQPGAAGGTVWAPMPYSPDTGYFYLLHADPDRYNQRRRRSISVSAAHTAPGLSR